jgi:hypothetical protein
VLGDGTNNNQAKSKVPLKGTTPYRGREIYKGSAGMSRGFFDQQIVAMQIVISVEDPILGRKIKWRA